MTISATTRPRLKLILERRISINPLIEKLISKGDCIRARKFATEEENPDNRVMLLRKVSNKYLESGEVGEAINIVGKFPIEAARIDGLQAILGILSREETIDEDLYDRAISKMPNKTLCSFYKGFRIQARLQTLLQSKGLDVMMGHVDEKIPYHEDRRRAMESILNYMIRNGDLKTAIQFIERYEDSSAKDSGFLKIGRKLLSEGHSLEAIKMAKRIQDLWIAEQLFEEIASKLIEKGDREGASALRSEIKGKLQADFFRKIFWRL